MPEFPSSLLFLALLSGGLLLPGWLLGRALGTPAGLVGAFLGSAAILFQGAMLLQFAGLPLDTSRLAGFLAAMCLLLIVVARRRPARPPQPPAGPPAARFELRPVHWLLVPAALAFAAIVVRAWLDPLSGFDTVFRWDFLARQMWRERSLDFYPAYSAADFIRYPWCDGIAPLVSSQYFWAYAALGRIDPLATAPAVILQAAVLFGLVYRHASLAGSPAAGCAALAILASGSILPWGVAMGQETGFTALALVALLFFLERHAAQPERRWLVWAGLAAALGALAREYGLAFVGLGAAVVAAQRVSWRGWLQYLIPIGLLVAPWYARNALRTGNPLYSQNLAGMFPTNPVHDAYMAVAGDILGLGLDSGRLLQLAQWVALLAGVPLGLGLIGALRLGRRVWPASAAIGLVVLLWLWSIGYTSGGYVYSLRVLTPALAVAAVVAGRWMAGLSHRPLIGAVAAIVALASADAAVRSLHLPIGATVSWWRKPWDEWRDFGRNLARWNRSPVWATVTDATEGRQIIVTDPGIHALITQHGSCVGQVQQKGIGGMRVR
jgi:hypothetical protein